MKRTNWSRFSVGSLALAAFLASGCGQPSTNTPGGDDGGTATTPTGPRSLSGKAQAIFRDRMGVTTPELVNIHDDYFAASFPNADGSWRTVPGVSHEDGTFEIAEAGDGQYWMRVFDTGAHRDIYILTDRSTTELNVDVPGRPDVEGATDDATAVLLQNVSGLDPWQDTDALVYVSANLGLADSTAAFPDTGSTTVTTAVPWSGKPLADASKKDDLMLAQLRHMTDDTGTFGYYTAIRSTTLDGVTLKQGEVNTLTGTLEPGEEATYPLHWKRSAFTRLASQVHPNYTVGPVAQGFAVDAMPGGGDRGSLLLWEPPVVGPDFDALSGFDDLHLDLPITKAFPESWWVNLYSVYFEVDVPVPGDSAKSPVQLTGSIGEFLVGMPDPNGSVEPLISPAQDPKINGKSMFEDQAKVGLTPTVSWTAPEIGKADAYLITIGEWEGVDQGVGAPNERALLMIPGDVTEVKVPPNVLREGYKYLIAIEAISQPNLDVRAGGLYQTRLPYGWADSYTNTFSP